MIKLLFVLIAIVGYIYNIRDRKAFSYYLWIISNGFWCMYNYSIEEYQMAAMFAIYTGFCFYGLRKELND